MNELLIKKKAVTKTLTKKKYDRSNPIYNISSFYRYSNGKKFDGLSFKSK